MLIAERRWLPAATGRVLRLLFATGVATMAAEVIWMRLYTYFVGPFVYSFAKILAAYLLATFCGSQIYRFWSRHICGRKAGCCGSRWLSSGCCLC